ncbi:hypothetical protein GGI15_002201 [Coemansia interrupta]|uniref:Peptidase S1 domain-containing protein n=1 Tax=Coemansia interrupta TaxID=1126814 RepID=A0A9W8LLB5_9FUNG|nr:hypothetical protein GGI15_002201 [Coemansia interrupta]
MEAGQTMLSLGWGATESTKIDRTELRGVLTTIGGAEQCNEQAGSDLTDGGSVVCALGSENKGKCIMGGDSGTGAVVNQNGVLMLAAINSQVTVYNGTLDCSGGELTAFYLRPAYFLDFIASSTGLTQEYLTGATDKL